MDKSRKTLCIFAAAAYMTISLMALVIESRKRKMRESIRYGPIDERDRIRIEYPKRAKTAASEEDRLQATLKAVGERLATAIEKAGAANNELPADLYENVHSISGFDDAHLSHYYAYLVEHPQIARAFNTLQFSHKVVWVASVAETLLCLLSAFYIRWHSSSEIWSLVPCEEV